MKALLQRVADWRRERLIRRLRRQAHMIHRTQGAEIARPVFERMFAECEKRSPGQVERMTERLYELMDPHARAVFDRARVKS